MLFLTQLVQHHLLIPSEQHSTDYPPLHPTPTVSSMTLRQQRIDTHGRISTEEPKTEKTTCSYLEIEDDLAHDGAKVPGLCDVTEDGGRETDDNDDEVSDGKVDNEQIGDGAQLTIDPDDEAHETVADDPDHEHDYVERDQAPLELGRPDVLADHVQVLFITDAVLVATVHRVECSCNDLTLCHALVTSSSHRSDVSLQSSSLTS